MDSIKCYGCGIEIQTTDTTKPGYVNESVLGREYILCQRCFRLQNYNEMVDAKVSSDEFVKILDNIANESALVVYVIDLFDFNGSMIKGLTRHVDNDILVVANKRDVVTKNVNNDKIKRFVKTKLLEYQIKPLDVILTSAKKNLNIDELMEAIEMYRNKRNVYVVGVTNVGKSTLINAIIKSYSDEKKHLITTSMYPGTTLDVIQIPIDDKTYLIDTPGIINQDQMAHKIDVETLKLITPKKEVKATVFQLNDCQSVYIEGLARFDYLKGAKHGFTFYFSNELKLHRTKLENADTIFDNRVDNFLAITANNVRVAADFSSYEFKLGSDNRKTDIVISGLGWITVPANGQKIAIKVPSGIGVYLRKALI